MKQLRNLLDKTLEVIKGYKYTPSEEAFLKEIEVCIEELEYDQGYQLIKEHIQSLKSEEL